MRMNRTQARQSGPLYLERLRPILFPIFELLEAGCAEAYKYIESTGAPSINAHLFSMLVRDHVCRGLDVLRRNGGVDFMRAFKAMCGIEVFFSGLSLKVLRPGADDGDGEITLPIPKSDQQSLFYLGNVIPYDDTPVFISNLVMLWESDHGTRTLSAWLACPDEGREALFCEPIPHPATGFQAPPPPPVPTDDLDDTYQHTDEEIDREAEAGEGEDE